MDYVVFGIGFGATILVLGLLLRDLGPRLRYRRGENGVLPADVLVAKVAWDRFCNALGAVLAIGGILFLIATFVCILLRLSDDTGGWVMLGSLALFFLLILYWTWAFFDRFGAYGILPERPVAKEPEPELVTVHQPAAVASPAGTDRPEEAAAGATAERDVPVGPSLAEIEPVDAEGDGPEDTETPDVAAVSTSTESPDADTVEAADGEEETLEPAGVEDETAEATDDATAKPDAEHEETVVFTPEERLARHEDPIDHESAAGDLDTEPGIARPSSLGGRRADPTPAVESEEPDTGTGTEGGEPGAEGSSAEPDARRDEHPEAESPGERDRR